MAPAHRPSNSYAPPLAESVQAEEPYAVRPGLPHALETPPARAAGQWPRLPSPARPLAPAFAASYTLSTHILPAAHPRTYPDAPVPSAAGATSTREARTRRVERAAKLALQTRLMYEDGGFAGQRSERPLWLTVNRYVSRGLGRGRSDSEGKRGLTLVLTHAIGFTKEYWEPVINRLLETLSADAAAPAIDEIWSLEFSNHGDSALLNAASFSNIYDWADCTRDILHFLLHYLPDAASPAALPTHLPRLPDAAAEARKLRGVTGRTVVGIGHSLGASTTALAAITHPALFAAIVLVDPVIVPPAGLPRTPLRAAQDMVIARRERWPSRAAALKNFQAMPFYRRWDPAALDLYVACALCPDPDEGADAEADGPVRLKMPALQEGVCFEAPTVHEVWALLPRLDARVRLHFVLAAQESIFSGPLALRRELAWRRPARASNRIVESGHLMVQEAPMELADELAAFLLGEYGARQGDIIRPKL